MDSHFSRGLTAGLNASSAGSARPVANFRADYKHGLMLGFSRRMFERTGDQQLSAWEVGILTRRYGLNKEMVINFFKESQSDTTIRFFMAGYRLEAWPERGIILL